MLKFRCAGVALFAFPFLASAAELTFYRNVLPVLENRCQECHRPGEIGPMALRTYKEVRPWAASMVEQVESRKMPPWDADPKFGHFANDRALSPAELKTLVGWAKSGAKEGDPKDAPKTHRQFVDGWNIPKPDVVLSMQKPFPIPAQGIVDYQYLIVPTGFTEDKWVQMSEIRPSDRSVVHHMVMWIREPGNKWLRGDATPGEPFGPKDGLQRGDTGGLGSEILGIYTPGMVPDVWKPGQARFIPAGSDIVFQMHYTPSGKATSDLTKLGLVFAKEPVKQRIISISASNSRFQIPPGDPNYEVASAFTFRNPGTIESFFPHMHVRGKDYQYRITYPDGKQEVLLNVPAYRFNWQLAYKPSTPLAIPAGSKIEAIAHFDNSANNPNNPDPKATVKFGEQTTEEMAVAFMDVAVDVSMTRRQFMTPSKPASSSPVATKPGGER